MKSNLFGIEILKKKYSKISLIAFCICFSILNIGCQNTSDSEKNKNSETTATSQSNTIRPNLDRNSKDDKNTERDNFLADDYSLNSESNPNSDNSNSFTKQDSLEFFKRFSPKTQTFIIDSDKDQHIFGEKGTHLFVEKSSFVFEDGTPVKSKVSVEMKEFYDKKTILLAGLATQTRNGFLESGGMIHLQATAEGKKVKLKKEITIEMPTQNTKVRSEEGMKVYFASNNTNNSNLDVNSPFNPPTTWQTNGRAIPVEVPIQNYIKWKYIGNLEHKFDKTDDTECDCADIALVYEKVETLSEAISYEIDFTHSDKKPSFLRAKTQNTELPKEHQLKFRFDKNTRIMGKANQLVYDFYPFLEDTTYYYDTLRIAFEIEKNRVGMVLEQFESTNNAIESYTTQTAIRPNSGLFITANLLQQGICSQSKKRFFLQSVKALSQVLPETEDKRGEWKRTQNGTEEAYQIEYKKRKNPIMVWTGVIKTMKTSYNNKLYYQGKGRTYKNYVDEELKKQYDEAKAKYAKWIDENSKNDSSFAESRMRSYVLKTLNLGWMNCDHGSPFRNSKAFTNLVVQTDSPVTLIFDKMNSVLTGRFNVKNGAINFYSVPEDDQITLFALKKKDGKMLMALHQTRIGKEPIKLEYKEVTFQEMQSQLDYLLI